MAVAPARASSGDGYSLYGPGPHVGADAQALQRPGCCLRGCSRAPGAARGLQVQGGAGGECAPRARRGAHSLAPCGAVAHWRPGADPVCGPAGLLAARRPERGELEPRTGCEKVVGESREAAEVHAARCQPSADQGAPQQHVHEAVAAALLGWAGVASSAVVPSTGFTAGSRQLSMPGPKSSPAAQLLAVAQFMVVPA